MQEDHFGCAAFDEGGHGEKGCITMFFFNRSDVGVERKGNIG